MQINQNLKASASDADVMDRILELKTISKSFGGLHALRDVTFNLSKNKVTGIIGPNGAGKSTLFNLITGYLHPDTGSIIYQGKNITGLSPSKIARLGIIRGFQSLRLFEQLSVLDNVVIYSKPQRKEGVLLSLLPTILFNEEYRTVQQSSRDCLELFQLDNKANTLAKDLSYAEQKLLNLARLFAMPGELILFDEPMSGVDIKIIDQITKLIKKLPDYGKTVCLIEHSLDVIQSVSDEIIFLGEGKVLFQGQMDNVFKNKELADMYLGV
jgi:ABC-type branched-subunit amino acid transport system ATPase component